MPPLKSRKSSGWDPWLIISQIVTLQSVHYLTLCLLVPLLLTIFTEPNALAYHGGATTVGVIMDWREMSSRPTVRGLYHGLDDHHGEPSGINVGKEGAIHGSLLPDQTVSSSMWWDGRVDRRRGWCIAFAWLAASVVDMYYLYIFVRRPRLLLDFSLTFMLNHLILTTYYTAAFPTSLFFWIVLACGTCLVTFLAEQLCIKREMREGLSVVNSDHAGDTTSERNLHLAVDGIELEQLRRD